MDPDSDSSRNRADSVFLICVYLCSSVGQYFSLSFGPTPPAAGREKVPQLSRSRPQVFGCKAQIAVEHQLHGGSRRQHYFGAARAEYSGQTSSGARDGSDAGSSGGGLAHRLRVTRLVPVPFDATLRAVQVAARIGAAGARAEVARDAIG